VSAQGPVSILLGRRGSAYYDSGGQEAASLRGRESPMAPGGDPQWVCLSLTQDIFKRLFLSQDFSNASQAPLAPWWPILRRRPELAAAWRFWEPYVQIAAGPEGRAIDPDGRPVAIFCPRNGRICRCRSLWFRPGRAAGPQPLGRGSQWLVRTSTISTLMLTVPTDKPRFGMGDSWWRWEFPTPAPPFRQNGRSSFLVGRCLWRQPARSEPSFRLPRRGSAPTLGAN